MLGLGYVMANTDKYRIEDVEVTPAKWGTIYTVNFRSCKDQFLHLHRVTGPSLEEMLARLLAIYGK